VPVLPRYRVAPRPLLAIYPQTSAVPRKVQVFVDFMRGWIAEQDFQRPHAVAAE
jgi:DNA-binding transcriptional LysR family regulator